MLQNKLRKPIFEEPVEIRLARAKDPDSSPDLLKELSKDKFWFVRDFVASNISTPLECLENLCNDSDFRVRSEARKNHAQRRFQDKFRGCGLDAVIHSCEGLSKNSEPRLNRAINTDKEK